MHFTVFLLLPRKLQPAVALKLYSKGPLTVREMHEKPILFNSRYLGRNDCRADYEKLKITSEQKTFFQMSRGWDNILGTLTLDYGPSSFYGSIASCLPVSSRE